MYIAKKWVVIGNYSVAEPNLDPEDDDYEDSDLVYGGCGCCGGGPHSAITHEPEARLMAAAPELLRALRRCVGPDPEGLDLLGLLDDIQFKED